MRRQIPNFITLINLYCGCCALVNIFLGNFLEAFYFIFIGALADYSDGMVARWLDVKSPFGKELDSIADMVTFGVVPGAILYVLLLQGQGSADFLGDSERIHLGFSLAASPAFILSVFSAIRLAKFNLDTRQIDNFVGLNTPACTVFVVGLMLIYHFDSMGMREWVVNPIVLYGSIAFLSFLLVAELPMMSFKFKHFRWNGNKRKIIFLLFSIICLVMLRELALALIIVVYVLFSFVDYLINPQFIIK